MKKLCMILVVVLMISIIGYTVVEDCDTVKHKTIPYSTEHYLFGVQPISPGYDDFGYNYQAHMFNGYYTNAYLGKEGRPPYEGDTVAYYQQLVVEDYFDTVAEAEAFMTGVNDKQQPNVWHWEYRDVTLMMKWSDVWLSNKDCNNDDKLDRGYLCDTTNANSSACEGSWLTNHQSGTCVVEGKEHRWTYFVKIVYVDPENAYVEDGVWYYTADDVKIGSVIWGAYAIIQQVDNDPCLDLHGISYRSPAGPGLGKEW